MRYIIPAPTRVDLFAAWSIKTIYVRTHTIYPKAGQTSDNATRDAAASCVLRLNDLLWPKCVPYFMRGECVDRWVDTIINITANLCGLQLDNYVNSNNPKWE